MLSAGSYIVIYLVIVSFFTILFITKYRPGKEALAHSYSGKNITLFLAIFFALFIGLRPVNSSFVDMITYAGYLDWLKNSSLQYSWDKDNVIFDNLMLFASRNNWAKDLFFLIIAVIYFIGTFIGIKRIFPNNSFAGYIVWLGAFSTFSYSVNGIKAGAAAAVFIIAISFYHNKIISIALAIISLGFHHSMQLPVIAYIIALIFRKDSWYFKGWILCLFLSLFHVTFFQTLFAGWTDEHGASYLNSIDAEFVKHKGFRIDFVIYSIFPVIMGYYAIVKYKFRDKLYGVLLRTYTLTNAIWMLCMYAPFNNRIAYLSWLMYPIVLIYPCMKIGQFNWPLVSKRNLIIGLHLSFTLFMNIIYY